MYIMYVYTYNNYTSVTSALILKETAKKKKKEKFNSEIIRLSYGQIYIYINIYIYTYILRYYNISSGFYFSQKRHKYI